METTTTSEVLNICDRNLIDDIKLGVDVDQLPTEFTTADIAQWIEKYQIKKLDGTSYPPISTEALLNYAHTTPITKKRKQKVLYVSLNEKLFSFNPFNLNL